MADIDDVLARMAHDPAFREQVRSDPRTALDRWQLSTDDLARVQADLDPPATGPSVRSLFEPTSSGGHLAGLIGLLVPAAVAGLLVGTLAGAAGVVGGASPSPASVPSALLASTDGRDRPSGVATLTLHRGDRVLIVARDASGDWLQVRDPSAPRSRVWVDAAAVNGDDDLGDLPEAACPSPSTNDLPVSTTLPGEPATSSTVPGDTTTSTSVTTSTSAPSGATLPPTTGTTGTPDTHGPTFGTMGVTPSAIWEAYPAGGGHCADRTTAKVSVSVHDDSSISSVRMAWAFGKTTGSVAMTGSGASRSATLGPFPYPASIPDDGVDVHLTITARDAHGNQSTTTGVVRLHSASECIG